MPTFLEHLQELKNRSAVVLVSLLAASVGGYFLRDTIIRFLLLSRVQPLFYTSPTGGLDFVIKICLLFGAVVSTPILLFEVLAFIEPLLPRHTRYQIIQLLLVSLLLMILGMAFAYRVSLPAALHFLAEFGSEHIQSLISTSEYLSFVTVYLVGFGILFQLPLVMMLVNRIKPLSVKTLWELERYVILVSFVVAAILTPTPDFVNQTIMALPLILLYQISVVLVWVVNRATQTN